MTRLEMVVVTPSYGPDFELCRDLNRTVMKFTDETVRHQIVVPRNDLELFSSLSSERTSILCESDFLPRSFRRIGNYEINLRRPFPPIRPWIKQQIIKLEVVARLQCDVAVIVDSDIVFRRPFGVGDFTQDGRVQLFCWPAGVTDGEHFRRHVMWHEVARRLLGVPVGRPPFDDFVSSLTAWDPVVVRDMLKRIGSATGRPWQGAIGRNLHFSEWTLYGCYVTECLPRGVIPLTQDNRCHGYWGTEPLDLADAVAFVEAAEPTSAAIMISAKSRTPVEVRRKAFEPYVG